MRHGGLEFPDQPRRVLLCIAHDPGARLRDIGASLGITDRSAYSIATDLTAAGYVVKHKDGRRNRYQRLYASELAAGAVTCGLAG